MPYEELPYDGDKFISEWMPRISKFDMSDKSRNGKVVCKASTVAFVSFLDIDPTIVKIEGTPLKMIVHHYHAKTTIIPDFRLTLCNGAQWMVYVAAPSQCKENFDPPLPYVIGSFKAANKNLLILPHDAYKIMPITRYEAIRRQASDLRPQQKFLDRLKSLIPENAGITLGEIEAELCKTWWEELHYLTIGKQASSEHLKAAVRGLILRSIVDGAIDCGPNINVISNDMLIHKAGKFAKYRNALDLTLDYAIAGERDFMEKMRDESLDFFMTSSRK